MRAAFEFAARWNQLLDQRQRVEDDAELRPPPGQLPACQAMHSGFELACDVLGWQGSSVERRLESLAMTSVRDDLAQRVLADLNVPAVLPAAGADRRSAARRRNWIAAVAAVPLAAPCCWRCWFRTAAGRLRRCVPRPTLRPPAKRPQSASPGRPWRRSRRSTIARLRPLGLAQRIGAVALSLDRVAQGAGVVALDTSHEFVTVVDRIPDVAIELAGERQPDLTAASEPCGASRTASAR